MPRNAPNRTDLLTPGPTAGPAPGQGQPNGQPIQVPTGGPYGEAQQLQQAQAAAPLPQAPGPPGAPGGAPLDMGAALQAAKGMTPPQLGGLTRQTERPNEPVHAGLPGSPVSPDQGQRVTGTLSAMLTAIAQSGNNAPLSQLAARAAAAGQ